MKSNLTIRWLIRLLILFPLTGMATGALVCVVSGVEAGWGGIFGAVEGAVFGSMICWPTIRIPFGKIALFTATGTILFGTSSVWAWEGLNGLGGILYLSPVGFWSGYLALWLYIRRVDPARLKPIP